MSESMIVGIADMKIIRVQGILITHALGSCVGVCIHDPIAHLASMVHIMLPASQQNKDNIFKYADTGIVEAIHKMEILGAKRVRLVAKIAGGARMFSIPGDSDFGNIGERNVKAVIEELRKERIMLKAQDVGGTIARTMSFDVQTGFATIRTYGRAEKII